MKFILLLGMVSSIAFAQDYANPMAVQNLVNSLQIIGKTIVQDCNKSKIDEICEMELKKSLSIYKDTNILIIKPDMAMMHEYSHLRIYIQVDKDNKIQRAGL